MIWFSTCFFLTACTRVHHSNSNCTIIYNHSQSDGSMNKADFTWWTMVIKLHILLVNGNNYSGNRSLGQDKFSTKANSQTQKSTSHLQIIVQCLLEFIAYNKSKLMRWVYCIWMYVNNTTFYNAPIYFSSQSNVNTGNPFNVATCVGTPQRYISILFHGII